MKQTPRPRAFALVLVLIILMLAATMAVFFLSAAGQERRGVDLYARGSQVRHLAGMAVNRVMGQIGAATREGTAATPVSWASQPGMIRTYAASGTSAQTIYKLYSWDTAPSEAGGPFDPAAPSEIPPADWKSNPAVFTDLNQPINDVYPIVDPRAEGLVEGFSIDEANAAVAGSGLAAPMPVKWLYVLEDGQMVAPGSASGGTVTIAGASADNPIVGRVAFWTDDETSKVNINTASEGAYWDVPRGASRDEMQFAGNPPVRYEFQRFPGHPAMTSLSAVFPELLTVNSSDPIQTRWLSSYPAEMQALAGMTPRIAWGTSGAPYQGSQGGTYPVTTYTLNYGPARGAIPLSNLPKQVTLDTDRLYVSADDFWFRAPNPLSPVAGRQAQTPLEGLGADDLQRRIFFLTANSRAPETTLFEKPRISLWPITWPNASSYFPARTARTGSLTAPSPQDPDSTPLANINPKWITAEERLLAFCATLNATRPDGGDRYFFQRKDPDSPVNDWQSITRNRQLVTFLTREMSQNVPGFGGSLESGLGGGSATGWVALNALNYVRSLVNQYTAPDAQEGVRYSYTGVSFRKGRIGGIDIGGLAGTNEPNAKVVTPLRATVNGTEYQTVGNYPSLEEVAVAFYATQRREPIPPPNPTGANDPSATGFPEWRNPYNWQNLINLDPGNGYPVGAQTTGIRAVMLLDFTGFEPGVAINPVFWVKVTGQPFRVNGSNIGFPDPQGNSAQITFNSTSTFHPSANSLFHGDTAKIFNRAATGANVWQLVSDEITVSPTATTFSFEGSPITVEIYACDPTNVDADPTDQPSRMIYRKTMNFDDWTTTGTELPMPMAPRWSTISRSYRFNGAGSPAAAPAGLLPGGTAAKGSDDANAAMSRFERASGTDLWQPNPSYQSIPVPTPHPPGFSTEWAWAEYAPMITPRSGAAGPPVTDNRSNRTITQDRNRGTQAASYVYRTSNQAGYVALPNDPDDARESGATTRNLSTNFRKRVEALDQRNTGGRPAFCVEGFTATAPTDHNDPNSAPGSRTHDFFMQASEAPLRDLYPLLTPYDTVISMVNEAVNSALPRDPRLTSLDAAGGFSRITNVLSGSPTLVVDPSHPRTTARAQFHQFGSPGISPTLTGYQVLPTYSGNPFARRAGGGGGAGGDLGAGVGWGALYGAEFGGLAVVPVSGDWTGMPGRFADGGLLTRPDQEFASLYEDTSGGMMVPYFPRLTYGDYVGAAPGPTAEMSLFSPNRQIPSPVILGTIPRSPTANWQTLAFTPHPANPSHPGLASTGNNAPDHLLLDLFWMPVAEPYPISELFSTAGKVNLNYRIAPFSYIERKTALYAALKNTWMPALTENTNNTANYKSHAAVRDQDGSKTRYAIDPAQTLTGFDQVFNNGNIFRSASELCEISLIPQGEQPVSINSFWLARRLTPDNAREQPYNDLYSRVTTKSNTFTVHWRVQALRKSPSGSPSVWDESRDRTASELRGSTLVERYLDTNATDLPDYAASAGAEPLSRFYKWRVVADTYFQP